MSLEVPNMPVDVVSETVIERPSFSKLFAPFMAAAMRRENRKDLARLKALPEQRT
jgi:hypothetical protein